MVIDVIKVNNREYNAYKTNVSWGNFDINYKGEKRVGISPFISFDLGNNVFVGLELTFSDESFEETEIDIRTDISSYVTDILYEDEKGWGSFILGKYNCYITRSSEKNFKIELCLEYNELDDEINIEIDTIVELF